MVLNAICGSHNVYTITKMEKHRDKQMQKFEKPTLDFIFGHEHGMSF